VVPHLVARRARGALLQSLILRPQSLAKLSNPTSQARLDRVERQLADLRRLAGMVLVTVNPALKAGELEYVLRQSGAAGIFCVPEFRGNRMAEVLQEVRSALSGLREALLLSEWDDFERLAH
jgi:acyl-CoA synthetase (AMP-forming)/AMP-acid ligase II